MESQKNIFQIPSFNLGLLDQKLALLNRKAGKLGCTPITTKVLSVARREVQTEDWKAVVTFYEIQVDGIAPKFSDWEFVGTLEHTEAGNIVRSVPGQTLPETFRSVSAKCDHCETVRSRKDTYVVRHQTTGEFKQVGHSCVRDFLGHNSPEHLAWLASLIRELREVSEDMAHKESKQFTTEDFLQIAAEVVIRHGFVSKKAAQTYAEKSEGKAHLETTSGRAWQYLNPTPEMKRKSDTLVPSAEALSLVTNSLLYAEALSTKSNLSEYEHNLLMACRKEFVTSRDCGFLASLIGSYQRHVGELAEKKRKADESPSQWIGQIEKRETFELTVVGEHVFDGFQSFSETLYLYRMQDVNGNVCIWKTANKRLEVGKSYKLKSTVKKHDLWNGIKQTVLQRCAIVS